MCFLLQKWGWLQTMIPIVPGSTPLAQCYCPIGAESLNICCLVIVVDVCLLSAHVSSTLLKSHIIRYNHSYVRIPCFMVNPHVFPTEGIFPNENIIIYRRKFRSQTSDNMDRWKAEQGRGREKRKIRRKKSRRERVRRQKMQVREKVGKSRSTVFFQWFVAQ